jgi:Flp pilus assembly protein TadG
VTGRRRGDEGQAAVELALVLPLVVALMLAVVQVALIVRDQVLVVHAAREAAREAAVDPDPAAARRAAAEGSGLRASRLRVEVTGRGAPGSRVRVEVRYRAATDVPLVGAVLGELNLSGAAAMRVEQ